MAKKVSKKIKPEPDQEEKQTKEVKSPSLAEQSSDVDKDSQQENPDTSEKETASPVESESSEKEEGADKDEKPEKGTKEDQVEENSKSEDEPKDKDEVEDKKKKKEESEDEDEEKSKSVEDTVDTNKDGTISSREVVNAIDPEDSVSNDEPSQDELIAQKIEEQIEEKGEYFIIRIKKSVFLMLAGILVLSLWLIPLGRFLSIRYNLSFDSLKQSVLKTEESPEIEVVEPIEEESEASASAVSNRIRIKAYEETDSVKNMQTLLKNSGYDAEILVTDDIEDKGITVAAKQDKIDLLTKLMDLLKDDYFAASSSSQITSDSDFSAVVIVGK